ncbi:MAG: hypothetical protein AAF611_11815 [Bacteroidota bacterium]
MKQFYYIIIIACVFTSCRSGLRLIDQEDMDTSYTVKKTYPVDEFYVYVFQLCEDLKKTKKKELPKRFCDCKDFTFNQSNKKGIVKIEEIYLLKHRRLDLVLYLTTFSHKYINPGEGFLNDSIVYKDKIVLNEIETIYVGNLDRDAHKISFNGTEKLKDFSFYFDPTVFPEKMLLTKGNMATAENKYSIIESIPLDDVFKNDIVYVKSKYTIDYYENNEYRRSKESFKYQNPSKQEVSSISIASKNDDIEVIFSFKDFPKHYNLRAKRIRYHPAYEAISTD